MTTLVGAAPRRTFSCALPTLAEAPTRAFRAWREASARRAAYRRTCFELGGLTDRELDDLGLTRWEIDAVARRAVYGA